MFVLVSSLGLCVAEVLCLFSEGCFLWLTADQPELAFVRLFFAFWAGTARERNMGEVDKCSDMVVLSDGDVYLADGT